MNTTTITSADGTRLHFVRWDAPAEPRGHVLLVHGLAEHMGRYEHVAAALTAGGFAVSGIELRGHGHSGGRRGHVDRWSRYEEDVRAALAEVGSDTVFIVCHSMGGLVSLATLLSGAPAVKAIAISNPLLGVRVSAPVKEAAGRLLSRIWPTLSLGNELDVKQISRDAEVVRKYEEDPLVYSTITPRWFTEMDKKRAEVHAAASTYKVPMLMLLSEGDPITNPPDARRFATAAGGTIVEYGDEALHELFNELDKEKTLADVVEFLQAQS
ncbi:MAG: alpha/beta hydrolase [Proteobacteria bacterium]|nr:alpha/beta hydrolase [Pseudomonadota bacterium]MCP4916886.1 alpha/beta hydrolase [Pseudomonadota bacterium]